MNITCGPDLTIEEVSEAAAIVHDAAHEDAKIYFGTVFDMDCTDEMRITVIATGIQDVSVPVEKGAKVTSIAPAPVAGRPAEEPSRGFINRPHRPKINVSEAADLSVPAYLRNPKNSAAQEERRPDPRRVVNGPEDPEFLFDEEEFEIPSFIRMQAD
jgi:cell division protein FtsZ